MYMKKSLNYLLLFLSILAVIISILNYEYGGLEEVFEHLLFQGPFLLLIFGSLFISRHSINSKMIGLGTMISVMGILLYFVGAILLYSRVSFFSLEDFFLSIGINVIGMIILLVPVARNFKSAPLLENKTKFHRLTIVFTTALVFWVLFGYLFPGFYQYVLPGANNPTSYSFAKDVALFYIPLIFVLGILSLLNYRSNKLTVLGEKGFIFSTILLFFGFLISAIVGFIGIGLAYIVGWVVLFSAPISLLIAIIGNFRNGENSRTTNQIVDV